MDYKNIYDKLIRKAQERTVDDTVYYEKHHIIPRCMKGGNELSNIVKLTAKEHYLAHLLLTKIYPMHHGLVLAFNMMLISAVYVRRVTGRRYKFLRERHSEAMKYFQGGERNSQFGTKWLFHTGKKKSKKVKLSEVEKYILQGWEIGRRLKFSGRNVTNTCIMCQEKFEVACDQQYRKNTCSDVCRSKNTAINNKAKASLVTQQLDDIAESFTIKYGKVACNIEYIKVALSFGVSLNAIFKHLKVQGAGGNYETARKLLNM